MCWKQATDLGILLTKELWSLLRAQALGILQCLDKGDIGIGFSTVLAKDEIYLFLVLPAFLLQYRPHSQTPKFDRMH